MGVQIRVIPGDASPEELREALTHLAHEASRMPQVLGGKCPTRWDRCHKLIDELLDRCVGR